MPNARLFVPSRLEAGRPVELDADRAHYLGRVLRLRPGADLTLFDGSGVEYAAVIRRLQKDRAVLEVGKPSTPVTESPLSIRLVQCVARGERMDFVVQKATELGVREIQPVLSDRSVVRLDGERAAKRVEHWKRVAVSACEQSGRNRVPGIGAAVELAAFLAAPSDAALRVTLSPRGADRLSRVPGPKEGRVELLVGPEGGLSEDEIRASAAAGFRAFSLGPRILRTETAGMTALAILQSRFGDL